MGEEQIKLMSETIIHAQNAKIYLRQFLSGLLSLNNQVCSTSIVEIAKTIESVEELEQALILDMEKIERNNIDGREELS